MYLFHFSSRDWRNERPEMQKTGILSDESEAGLHGYSGLHSSHSNKHRGHDYAPGIGVIYVNSDPMFHNPQNVGFSPFPSAFFPSAGGNESLFLCYQERPLVFLLSFSLLTHHTWLFLFLEGQSSLALAIPAHCTSSCSSFPIFKGLMHCTD